MDGIEDELSEVTIKHDTDRLTELIEHFSEAVLHPNHYLLMRAKRNYVCLLKKERIRQLAGGDKVGEKNEYEESLCNSYRDDLMVMRSIGWGI